MSEEKYTMYCTSCDIEADDQEINTDNWLWLNHGEVMCNNCERNLTKDERGNYVQ
tara:strand:- start:80 stop:244 length:165 start_codon:yes stop_codon:yes gene_type:complete